MLLTLKDILHTHNLYNHFTMVYSVNAGRCELYRIIILCTIYIPYVVCEQNMSLFSQTTKLYIYCINMVPDKTVEIVISYMSYVHKIWCFMLYSQTHKKLYIHGIRKNTRNCITFQILKVIGTFLQHYFPFQHWQCFYLIKKS